MRYAPPAFCGASYGRVLARARRFGNLLFPLGAYAGACPALPCARPPPSASFGRCRSFACSARPARAVGLLYVGHPAGGVPPCARSLRLPLSPRASQPRQRYAPLLPRPARLRRADVVCVRPPLVGRPHTTSALRGRALSCPRACPALPCARALPPLRPPGVSASFGRGDPVRPPPRAPPSSLRMPR